jgi:tRNA nucleotidyltransferase (CCA-adding enzyme)
MRGLAQTLKQALRLADPSLKESGRIAAIAGSMLERTLAAASKTAEFRGAVLGGSFAKGTWLPGQADVDIFVKLDPSTPAERFEEVGLAVGRAATRGFPGGKKYAQHPYTEATVDGVKVNIVPCYAVIQGAWQSAADRSPFHVELIGRLPGRVKSQVRLLKLFMKGVGVYGAEIEVQGFSGYVAEVLVMKHGGFEGVLRWFSRMEIPKDRNPFSLPDPVDINRDLGTAVSGEKLGTMVLASRGFLRHPSIAYFGGMKRVTHKVMEGNVLAVVFPHPHLSEDTLWGELRKTTKHFVRKLEVSGFRIARAMAASNDSDRSAILLIPEFRELPELEQRIGPTVDREKDAKSFLASEKRRPGLVWVDEDARLRTLRPRRYTMLDDLIQDIVRGKAGDYGGSRDLVSGLKGAVVLEGGRLAKKATSTPWLKRGLEEIVSDAVGTGEP